MISQHYYMCSLEKRSKYENYTVAKSPELKEEHIKEYFEPLCKYIINSYMYYIYSDKEFGNRGFILNLIPTGELVISEISYKQIGEEKFNLFIHSYILSGIEKNRFVKMPEKIFGINNFGTQELEGGGRTLPTLAAIPYEESNIYFKDKDNLLALLGIDKEEFIKLVQAVITAVGGDSRVWVRLAGSAKERDVVIKAFLYHLHREVPWIIGEKIGVNTTGKWRITFPNIHLTFLESDEILSEAVESDDYIFDFKNREFHNIGDIVKMPRYFKSKERFSQNRNLWEKYNLYVSEIYKVEPTFSEENTRVYECIAVLLNVYISKIENKRYIIEEDEREGLLKELVRCISLPLKPEVLKELEVLIKYLFENLRVSLRYGGVFKDEEVNALIEYEKLHINRNEMCGVQNEALFNDIIVKAATVGDTEYIKNIMMATKDDLLLYKYIFNILYLSDKLREDIVYTYFEKTIWETRNLKDIIVQIKKAEEICIVDDEFYIGLIIARVSKLLEETDDVYYFFDVISRECAGKDKTIYNRILIFVEDYFIQHTDLETLDDEDKLCKLHFVTGHDEELYHVIMHYQKLRKDLREMSPHCIVVDSVVQNQIKRVYNNGLSQDRFYMIIYAFLTSIKNDEDVLGWEIDLKSALGYMYDISEKLAIDFIIWSKGQKLYINNETFDDDVKIFFLDRMDGSNDVNMKVVKKYLYNNSKTKQLFINLHSDLMRNRIKLMNIYGMIATVEKKIKNKK